MSKVEHQKLDEISHILYSEEQKKGSGKNGLKHMTIYTDAYDQLEGVIQELRAGKGPDEIQIRTLQNVQMRIAEVMRIAREYRTDNKESKADDPVTETRSDGASGD